ARLGPDPIRDDADAAAFVAAVGRSRVTIGQQLMDQAVVAGVGNIYRAEALFRAGVDPLRPGRDVPEAVVRAIWDDLVVLMRDGAEHGANVTTRPEHRTGEPVGRRRTRQNTDGNPDAVPADQAFYVYHRDGLPCRVCGTPVLVKELAGRNLFWCPTCQVWGLPGRENDLGDRCGPDPVPQVVLEAGQPVRRPRRTPGRPASRTPRSPGPGTPAGGPRAGPPRRASRATCRRGRRRPARARRATGRRTCPWRDAPPWQGRRPRHGAGRPRRSRAAGCPRRRA